MSACPIIVVLILKQNVGTDTKKKEIKISQCRGRRAETPHFIDKEIQAHCHESLNFIRVHGSCKHIHLSSIYK